MSPRIAIALSILLSLVAAGCYTTSVDSFVPAGTMVISSGESVDTLALASGDVTVEDGGAVEDDVLMASGTLTVDEGGRIGGDVVLASGTVVINGEVGGDIYAVSGNVTVGPNAKIGGSVGALSGVLLVDESAEVGGEVTEGALPARPIDIQLEPPSPFEALLWVLLRSLVPALLAGLIAVVVPERLGRVAQTGAGRTGASTAAGCLTFLFGTVLLVVLVVLICTIPLAILLGLALMITAALGWAGLGLALGRRMSAGLGIVSAATIGTFVLSVAVGIVALIPCIGWTIELIANSAAVGAALLTRWGSRPHDLPPVAGSAITPAGGETSSPQGG
jgi:cytoskeletal protein CcmA (bactofilin family)